MVVLRGKEGSVSAHQHSETLPRSLAVIYTGKAHFLLTSVGGIVKICEGRSVLQALPWAIARSEQGGLLPHSALADDCW